jgi:16S rRNA (guanine(966)-N(2))-methyltransferase RsmD
MRVISGEAKSRRLYAVPGDTTRPITDRVKTSLFNILADRIEDARFLDLFAGTGGVGIEALSRGAREAVFVEREPRALATIRRNLEVTGLADYARVLRKDVFKFIVGYAGEPFDLVYVAPPQYKGLWAQTLEAMDGTALMAPDGLAVAQIHPKEYGPLTLTNLALTDQRKYGSTLLCFYALRNTQSPRQDTGSPADWQSL